MRIVFKIFLVALLFMSASLNAQENAGSLSITIFKDGKPLKDTQVVIDKKDNFLTDSDGSLEIFLNVGKHKVEIFAKKDGINLGYFRRSVEIKKDKDTQITAEFSEDDSDEIDIDTPFDTDVAINKATGTATFSGTVISSDTKNGVANARIFVMGTDVDARTDENGNFAFSVPSGIKLNISFIHSEHTSQTLKNVVVKKDNIMQKTVSLTPASMELEEFVVLAPKVKGSIASIMAEEKQVNAIANILGSEQMNKRGDSSAAAALKRVTGVTLVGGKDVYVRGLGERYSNIEMNSMPLPSPDPLKRSVPLDIFPAGAISSMKVQKSATADVPANFGGGYVDIRTKDSSQDDYLKLSIGAKGNSDTGSNVYTYKGSDTDMFGFDDGYRDIDSTLLENSQVVPGEAVTAITTDNFTKEELSKMTQDYVNRNYDVTTKKQDLGYDFGVEANKIFEIADNHVISVFANYKYETDSNYRDENYYRYNMQSSTGKLYPDPTQYGTISQSTTKYIHNAMLNIGYSYANAFDMKYTKLYTHNAEKVTKIADGIMGSNDEDMTRYYLNWEERTLDVDQLNAKFNYKLFGNENNVKFGLENAKARLFQPNNFQYTYRNEGEPFLDHKVSNHIANRLETQDDLNAFYINNKFHYELFSTHDYLDLGLAMSSKQRSSKQNKFFLKKQGAGTIVDDKDMTGNIEDIYDQYVRADINYDDRSLIVNQLFKPADYYDADVSDMNMYVNFFLRPLESIEVLFGLRYTDFSQTVYQYEEDRDNPDFSLRRLIVKKGTQLVINSVYPSFTLKYNLDKNNIFDIAFAQTYIAPDLREFTEGEYYHPYEVATILGNPNLVNTDIYSFDLKYSHYYSDSENIKLGLFFKFLDKPIEDVMVPSSSLPIYSYDNADTATLYGLEVDGRKSFAFIDDMFKNYFISGNFSYTESEVILRAEQEDIYSTNYRELQGLSKIIVNLSLSYESKNRSTTLSYNKMGKRIRKVGMFDPGTNSNFPDYYEDPAAVLDFVWVEKFDSGMSIKAKVGNILDGETQWYQGTTRNITNSFKKGQTYSISASYKY